MWRGGGAAATRGVTQGVSRGCPRVPSRSHRPPRVPPCPPQDLALPHGGWSEAMTRHYQRLRHMADTGTGWVRLPSYRRAWHHLSPTRGTAGDTAGGDTATSGGDRDTAGGRGDTSGGHGDTSGGHGDTSGGDRDTWGGHGDTSWGHTRLFLRAIDVPGAGFEYSMFLNAGERRLLCLCQPGPYLEGHPGLTHGGAIAAIIDSAMGTCALAVAGRVVTANLNIDYVAPVPLGTVLLLEGRAQRPEGRKVLTSCQVRGADGDILHAKATGLFIRLEPSKEPRDGGA
ncbi:acyl-coenzyme A thioesterase THEM4-like isoform 1-T1 [Phaethornis superciliosus]